ncbi:uncharacterized protein LOC116140381 [Pistacia vera]|uniref:uncharacterized protein LOC116140381 n=1 Tax=Pistacia vera TaxID=55513 RepID=UPI001262C66C|nr:uncharacterized protein LOC116140381 [Pistacia vera]
MNKKKDKEFVDKMLAKCFEVNNIAFNVVQTGVFGEFVKAMAEYGVAYKLPSYSTLRTKLIPESRKGVDEYIDMVKHSWDTSRSGCTIMFDIWTKIRHRSFTNLVAYSPGSAVFIKSLDVSRERKTRIYLKEIVVSVIESIGQEHTRCAAHGIQLLLKDIYEEVNWVKVAIDEARIIVMFMTRGFDYCKTESGKRVTEIVQRDFWARGREVIKTIEPLVQVLCLVDSDGSTAGYLYEAMMRAKVAIKERCNSEEIKEDKEMKDDINFIHENLILIEEKHPFMREVQLYHSRPATLFTATAKAMLQTSHPPLHHVREIGVPLKLLKQKKERNRLSHEMLDTLVYVMMNTMMMDKFTSTMSRDLEPIDLEKLGELLDYEYEEIHMDEDANATPTIEGYMDDLMDNDDIAWLDDALF